MITINEFKKIDIRIGTIQKVESLLGSDKKFYQLTIDFGVLGIKKSCAQITDNYTEKSLVGRQIAAIINISSKKIADTLSEVLILGVEGNAGGIILLKPDKPMQTGIKIS